MSAPLPHPFEVVAGDTKELEFELKEVDPNDPTGETLRPRDLTGWTVRSQIRHKHNSETVLAELKAEPLGPSGLVVLELTSTDSQALSAYPTCVWDAELTSPEGKVNTFVAGKVKVLPDVTRG